MKKEKSILVILIFLLFILNYNFLDSALENFLEDSETIVIVRVIDGDTIVGNESIRLLGINSPERNELYYGEAKEFLEELVLNKSVSLEFGKDKYDRYRRVLAYIFIGGKNVNLKLVENGFANYYFPSGGDIYYNDFVDAWKKCIDNEINLCQKSENICGNCIVLKEFDVDVLFYNQCGFDCEMTNWEIKDEGRKKFYFPEFVLRKGGEVRVIVGEGEDNSTDLFWGGQKYVWTKTGDTLFLRDDVGKLVLWENL